MWDTYDWINNSANRGKSLQWVNIGHINHTHWNNFFFLINFLSASIFQSKLCGVRCTLLDFVCNSRWTYDIPATSHLGLSVCVIDRLERLHPSKFSRCHIMLACFRRYNMKQRVDIRHSRWAKVQRCGVFMARLIKAYQSIRATLRWASQVVLCVSLIFRN